MTSHWQSKCGRYCVEIESSVMDQMVQMARVHFPNEVGTALVGTYTNSGHLATITGLAPYTPDSMGRRTRFLRGSSGLKQFFADLFRSSKGETYYVGEWHSHPGGYPEPSGTDDGNAFAIAKDRREHCPECILVIVGIREEADLGTFVYSRNGRRIRLSRETPVNAEVNPPFAGR